jgi:hypothetical protein
MKSLTEAATSIILDANVKTLTEEFLIENVDEIADRMLDKLCENNLEVFSMDEAEFDSILDSVIEESAHELDESIFGAVVKKVAGLFGGSSAPTHNQLANGLSPNPKRLSNQPKNPAVVQAKEQIKKRIQHGSRARKSVLSQLTADQKASLGDNRMVSRTRNGVVAHYMVPKGEKFSAKTHKSFMQSKIGSDGNYSHEKFED